MTPQLFHKTRPPHVLILFPWLSDSPDYADIDYKKLQDFTGLSIPEISRALAWLDKHQIISLRRKKGGVEYMQLETPQWLKDEWARNHDRYDIRETSKRMSRALKHG